MIYVASQSLFVYITRGLLHVSSWPRVILADQDKASIVDVDGSYTHRKYVSLREAGEQVLLPTDPPPPLTGWKQVTEATYKDLAGCIPQVTFGRH